MNNYVGRFVLTILTPISSFMTAHPENSSGIHRNSAGGDTEESAAPPGEGLNPRRQTETDLKK